MRDGVAFGKGDLADEGLETVDVLYTPERNEFRGRATAQLMVDALVPAEGTVSLPDGDALFRSLLQEIATLAANDTQLSLPAPAPDALTSAAVRRLMQTGRNVLLIGHDRANAARFLSENQADVAIGAVRDARAFNTVLMVPVLEQLTDVWADIVLLDGDVLPGEAALIARRCPRAALHVLKGSSPLKDTLASIAMDDDTLRHLYRRVRLGGVMAVSRLSEDTGLTPAQVLTGLMAFRQVGLVDMSLEPFAVRVLPPVKCRMDDSALVRYLRAL